MGKMILLGIGVTMTALSLLFVALSFATDHWIEYAVNRGTALNAAAPNNETYWTNPLYFSRNRGLFRTCYPGTEAAFLESAAYSSQVIDGICLKEEGYELTQRPETVNYGSDYETRKHLMRAHVGLQILSMLALLVSVCVCIVACWQLNDVVLRYGALASFLGGFAVAGAMACFHGYDYLEREKIAQAEFRKIWHNVAPLNTYAGFDYGYSYICGWIGVGLALFSTIFLLCAANAIAVEQDEELEEPKRSRKRRNKSAYDYMDERMGVPMPVYPPSYDYGPPSLYPAVNVAPSGIFPSDPIPQYPAIEYPTSASGYGY